MSLIVYTLALIFTGLVVGALARLALPGRDPMSIVQTILVGIAGSFAAGLLYALVFHRNGGGIVLSDGDRLRDTTKPRRDAHPPGSPRRGRAWLGSPPLRATLTSTAQQRYTH